MLTPAKPERGRLVSSEAPRRGTTWDESSRGRLPAVRWRWALVAFALVGAAGVLRMVSHVRARGPAAASPTDALAATQAAAAARRASRNLLSPFEPSCLRTTRARDCPGFEECLGVMSGTPWQPPNPLLLPALQLPQCSKENCLNRSKCHLPFRVFGYNRNNVPEPLKICFDAGPNHTLRDRLPERSRHLVTDDPSRACVFFLEIDNSRKGACDWRKIAQLPHWHASSGGLTNGGGMNHVLFDVRDNFITIALRHKRLGRAALAVTASWTERFVTGLDISVALGQQNYDVPLTAALAATLPWDRRWLAAFKGSQSHPSRRTMSMEHDEKEGFISMALSEALHTCKTLPPKVKGRTGLIRKAASASVEARALAKGVSLLQADCCDKARDAYELYDYKDVQNSTFALILAGHGPATYRLTETLRMGSIPVFVGIEQLHVPYGHAPRWEDAAFFVPTSVDIRTDLLPLLRKLHANRTRTRAMQKAALRIYSEWFSSEHPARAAVLEVLRRRFEFESDE
mmetsp:Transcript_42298/g.99278  ORF Transcript_42298/g.99278 Transcript_42298/m.99278 type:complete len:515 (-) Transcript_42298:196-1740(-)